MVSWRDNSTKVVFHIADAPGHGEDICEKSNWDRYPKGSPDGFKIQDQMKEFAKRDIHFTFVKVNDICTKMIEVMRESYSAAGGRMEM